mgnify:CR=1 FL=1
MTRKSGAKLVILGVLALVVFAGCTTLELSAVGLDETVSMTGTLVGQPYEVIDTIRGTVRGVWILGFPLVQPDVRSILIREGRGADGFVNVEITTQQGLIDWAITAFTGGFIQSRLVIVEGTAVEF